VAQFKRSYGTTYTYLYAR